VQIGQTFGSYQILAKAGTGGMGEVYRAHDTRLGRDVALKILAGTYTQDQDRIRRFRQEATAASALNHPGILTIHEAGEEDGCQFIATEFVEGETVRQVLNQRGRLPLNEALGVAVQVAAALAAAHKAGIVHRDIKPENVMVRPDGYVKVLDFGIAKLTERPDARPDTDDMTRTLAQTRDGAILGTVAYMSPEQARGAAVDARSDIWSLGCLLYEMLAGRSPFAGPTTSDMLVGILDKEPAPLTAPPHDVPAECDWIITKTLRKNAGERYQKTDEFLTDVRRLQDKLALESHQQRALPPPPRPSRPSSRMGAAMLAAVLIAGAIATVWYWRPRPAPSSTTTARSLAVLPLKSLDAGDNYLGLGIADAVIRRTSQTGGMIVRPTSAIQRYMTEDLDALTAARQLSTDVVLEGSVQRSGDRLRVSVNLLRVVDGVSLWADSFDLRTTDIFEIQDRVAREVASHLQLRIDPAQQARLGRRPTTNPQAYEYYLRGLHRLDQRMSFSVAEKAGAIDFFNRAIAADPDFALAHAQLALAYAIGAVFRQSGAPETDERARAEIARAQALDPDLPEIALARAALLKSRFGGFRGDEAVRVLLAAQRIDPNVGHADLTYNYTHLGLAERAERAGERALEIDPTSDYAKRQLIASYEMSARWDSRRAAQLRFFPSQPMDAWSLLTVGRLDDARRAVDLGLASDDFSQFALGGVKALVDAWQGDIRSAKAAIPSLLSRHPVKDPFYHHTAYFVACIYAAEANSVEAVQWLREAVATGFVVYPLFERDALLDRIRNAPEFVQFMTELKARVDGYRREFAGR
jgi:serine/threonine protein kinase/tetratricopeptide (TPR) repeat protein